MIKIVQGIYGYQDKNGVVRPKTPEDAPFSLTEAQEKRLVGLGVAEYVGNVPEHPQDAVELTEDENTETDIVVLPEYNADMTTKELREIAKAYKIELAARASKKEILATLDEKTAALEAIYADDSEDVEMPELDATVVVE
jgi:hypothetical protein